MVSALISRIVILIFGTLYPAYASYKAVKTKNVKLYVKWMMYWIVFAFFTCIETFADIVISWVPFYYEVKILFVFWLLSPATKGASILYRKFLHPQLSKREKDIDAYLAKASDQGYSALLKLGTEGINYATNVVITNAIKGQSKIADHLRKSYSMNDLSAPDSPGRTFPREDSLPDDDEIDNRLVEESYRRELRETPAAAADAADYEGGYEGEEEDEGGDDGGDDRGPAPPRRGQRDEEERPRKRRPLSSVEPELQSLEEGDEPDAAGGRVAKRSSRKAYSHTEAYHYGTLPRSKTRSSTRASAKDAF